MFGRAGQPVGTDGCALQECHNPETSCAESVSFIQRHRMTLPQPGATTIVKHLDKRLFAGYELCVTLVSKHDNEGHLAAGNLTLVLHTL